MPRGQRGRALGRYRALRGRLNHTTFRASIEFFDELKRRDGLQGRFGRFGRAHWTEVDGDSVPGRAARDGMARSRQAGGLNL
jgi:hypothetical protein